VQAENKAVYSFQFSGFFLPFGEGFYFCTSDGESYLESFSPPSGFCFRENEPADGLWTFGGFEFQKGGGTAVAVPFRRICILPK